MLYCSSASAVLTNTYDSGVHLWVRTSLRSQQISLRGHRMINVTEELGLFWSLTRLNSGCNKLKQFVTEAAPKIPTRVFFCPRITHILVSTVMM